MLGRLREIIVRTLGPLGWGRRSYSQEGEDIALDRFMGGRETGFYVEVGCHHPFRFSNTYLFYRRGWRGICVDPLPGTVRLFRRWRRRDVVIEMGVSGGRSSLVYHLFNEPAVNTFSSELARERCKLEQYKIVALKTVETDTLANILDRNLIADQRIDFFSIDVEGMDLEVLQSNNWQKYRPEIVVTECLEVGLAEIAKDPIARFLESVGYLPHAKTGNSVMFVNANRDIDQPGAVTAPDPQQ